MANNYRGIFWGLDKKKYRVDIVGNRASSTFFEIELAADSPFIVSYAASQTPFDPIRTSTAQINIVHNSYMEDILSNNAQGTKIELLDITDSGNTVVKWTGFLTPKIYDASYQEEFETFQLEAADCLSSLQYIDYSPINEMGMVSFAEILGQIISACSDLYGLYWTNSKTVGNNYLLPEYVHIVERNFFYNDTEEPMKLLEVLEEICRYFGFTAVQWGKYLYLIDYQYFHRYNQLYCTYYNVNGYNSGTAALDISFVVNSGKTRADDAQISFEPVYNKVEVHANFYTVDKFIPSPFDDNYLINRNGPPTSGNPAGDFYASLDIEPKEEKGQWEHGGFLGAINVNQEKTLDTDYVFRGRLYDHKYWESYYSNFNSSSQINPGSTSATTSILVYYRGGTIVDLGVVKKPSRNQSGQQVIPSKMDYTRYLCIRTGYSNDNIFTAPAFKLKSGYKSAFIGNGTEYLIINYSVLWEKYGLRPYINPEWSNETTAQRGAGTWHGGIGKLQFSISIGGQSWDGSSWSGGGPFLIDCEWDVKNKAFRGPDCWNTEMAVLNNVSWEDQVNMSGYKIPLAGVDLTQEIEVTIHTPTRCVYGNTGSPDFEDYQNEYNAYMWVKDLSFDVVRKKHEGKEENDIVYSNVIDSGSIAELPTITCKITTDSELVQPSYSTVGYKASMYEPMVTLSSVTEYCISNTVQKPEDNIVEKYVLQYQTPTSKISMTLPIEVSPLQALRFLNVADSSKKYVQLGTEIDYSMGRQRITAVEKK